MDAADAYVLDLAEPKSDIDDDLAVKRSDAADASNKNNICHLVAVQHDCIAIVGISGYVGKSGVAESVVDDSIVQSCNLHVLCSCSTRTVIQYAIYIIRTHYSLVNCIVIHYNYCIQ